MPIIYLLRHGESESNVAGCYQGQGDSPLTEAGRKGAREACERLEGIPFVAAFSSDLSRAFETASIISKPHRLSVKKIKGFRERHYGAWEGKNFKEIEKKWPALYKKWLVRPASARIPKAETLKQLQRRAVTHFKEVIHPFSKNDRILMVAHGGWNRALLFHFLGMELDHFWNIRQTNCGLNIIELRSRSIVRTINA